MNKNKNDNIHKNEVQNIGFRSPSNFQVKEEEKLFKSVHKKGNWPLGSRQSFGESTISNFESQSKFQVKEKKIYSNRSRNNEIML